MIGSENRSLDDVLQQVHVSPEMRLVLTTILNDPITIISTPLLAILLKMMETK